MKKLYIALLCLCCSIFLCAPLKVKAESITYLYEGYTSDNIHYTVYSVSSDTEYSAYSSDALYLDRMVEFNSIIYPPQTIDFSERINSRTYKGTLSLYKSLYTQTTTKAYYRGYVFPYD